MLASRLSQHHRCRVQAGILALLSSLCPTPYSKHLQLIGFPFSSFSLPQSSCISAFQLQALYFFVCLPLLAPPSWSFLSPILPPSPLLWPGSVFWPCSVHYFSPLLWILPDSSGFILPHINNTKPPPHPYHALRLCSSCLAPMTLCLDALS